MSAKPGVQITMVVDSDGQPLIAAAGVVAWLRACADDYGSGGMGGSAPMRRGAHDALAKVADMLQASYIDTAADALTDRWWNA